MFVEAEKTMKYIYFNLTLIKLRFKYYDYLNRRTYDINKNKDLFKDKI